jgi:hypothetical protein
MEIRAKLPTEPMTLSDGILFHQIHAAKLVKNALAAVLSLYYLWRHDLSLAILAGAVPPLIATALVLRFADLKALQRSALGVYVKRYMTPAAQSLWFFDNGCCRLEARSPRNLLRSCGHHGRMAQGRDYADLRRATNKLSRG